MQPNVETTAYLADTALEGFEIIESLSLDEKKALLDYIKAGKHLKELSPSA